MKALRFILLVLMCFNSAAQAQQLPEDFDETVVKNMGKWHAPGLGLAIVKDGKTILAKGYGVKSFKSMDPVNENTLFQAGSTTKAFAAMSIAMLVDQGKAAWDDPIIKHIPEFKMKDPYVQNNLTIRDALSHSSGVGQLSNINMFIGKNIDETWAFMADVDQSASLRQKWDYNNTTFALAGRVVERLSGLKFHKFVEENILTPLGMDDTHLLDAEVRADTNRAEAHQHFDGIDYQIAYPYIEYTQAAGMINSTPVDMTKWMKFLLAKGKWNGVQLVSPEHIEEMMTPQILLNPADIYPAATTYNHDYYSYGLAWFVHDFRGRKMAMHTGSINGMIAIIGLIPEENMGIYAFINSDHIEYRHALMYQVLDTLLGHTETDWSEDLYPIYHLEADTLDTQEKSFPSVKPQDLVGAYKLNGSYPLNITKENGVLTARRGVEVLELKQNEDGRYLYLSPETRDVPWEHFMGIELDNKADVATVSFGGLIYKKQ